MTLTTYTATIWGDTYALRAEWGRNDSPIMRRDDESGAWLSTGRHVAEFRGPADAMRAELQLSARASGSDLSAVDRDITQAVRRMAEA